MAVFMSFETGISRTGTVIGASLGLLIGWYFLGSSYRYLDSQNMWLEKQDKFSDGTVFMAALAIGVVGFIFTLLAVKLVDKTVNWIIRGFKE